MWEQIIDAQVAKSWRLIVDLLTTRTQHRSTGHYFILNGQDGWASALRSLPFDPASVLDLVQLFFDVRQNKACNLLILLQLVADLLQKARFQLVIGHLHLRDGAVVGQSRDQKLNMNVFSQLDIAIVEV